MEPVLLDQLRLRYCEIAMTESDLSTNEATRRRRALGDAHRQLLESSRLLADIQKRRRKPNNVF
ncbi:MAG TPA: hypothetical protein VGE52_08575 [Pirellulales bacterium]